jgi:predicted nucleotidyltransferase
MGRLKSFNVIARKPKADEHCPRNDTWNNMNLSPTSYSDVNEILSLLYTDVKEILADQLVGMYLFGSLANGDFDEASDIDVLFVTNKEISESAFSSLKETHSRINKLDSLWAIQLEVSYIPKDVLRRHDPNNKVHPHMDRGAGEILHWMSHESDWIIQRYILRERGVHIIGPDLKMLIDPVSADERRRAVANVLPLWTDRILEDPSIINKRGYQSYCVLSLCRMLYTLQTGEIISKRIAADWANNNIDPRWHPLIERAWVGRQNPDLDADPADIRETCEMMRFTLAQIKPTPYPEVNEVLLHLLAGAKENLADQFVGMYLYGSLSSGDFNSETSDIDFLFVTKDFLSDETISQLEDMHKQTWATSLRRAGELEGAYVPQALIRRHDPNGAPCPTINEGKFYVASLGSDWIIQRHVVREYGVVVEGPDPKTLIDYVSLDDIRGAVMGILNEWWFPMLNDPSWLRGHPRGYHSFAILSMCRVLHALEHGTVASKPVAAKWAKENLPAKWSQIIDLALLAQKPNDAEFDIYNDAIEMIRYVREQTLKDKVSHDA